MGSAISGGGQFTSLIITAVVVGGLMLLRNRRPRRLRLEAMWIRPLIFFALVTATLIAAPPPATPISIILLMLALLIGAGVGWQRGRLMRIEVHPETHDITSRASPAGVLFILAILVLRMGMRNVAFSGHSGLALPASVIADGLIMLAGAMMIAQSIEMWIRARRLLGEARAAASPAPAVSPGANPPIVS